MKNAATRADIVVSDLEADVHDGNHYFVSGYEVEDAAGTIEFIFTTPNTKTWAHLTFEIVGQEQITVDVYEGAATIAGGSSATPINNNRNSSNTSVMTVTKDPSSIGSDGSLIDSYSIGATGQGRRTGNLGIASRDKSLILKQNETYLFRITSNAAANTISYKGTWSETQHKS